MKSLEKLFDVTLKELGVRCGTSTTRDLKTFTSRVESEGSSFYTITLANFGRDFQKSLDQGYVDRCLFTGFQFRAGLPQFLGGFLDLVFDRSTGRLLDVPSITAIRSIRQITLMFAKVQADCSPKRVKSAFSSYVKIEQEVRNSDLDFLPGSDNFRRFKRISGLLWADMFSRIDKLIYDGHIMPKHSSGSTADKLSGNTKYYQKQWPARLDTVFPDWENLIPNQRFMRDLDDKQPVAPGAEIPVRVIQVPKTLKTPRIIAMEPTAMMFMQQGILEAIVRQVERDDFAFNFVRSVSQEPNQRLAREGSLNGSLATLDLSEASDRVSNQHVRALLANHPHLFAAVDATRSRKADVPGHGVVRLAKFASMGSALCFPFESMVFLTVVFMGIEDELNRPLTKKDIKSFFHKVRVYGDDIIVPVDYVQSVMGRLETFGFRVNRNKSFWNGKFRESCGKDYYHGHDVSIVRVRQSLPSNRQCVQELISTVSLRNQLFHAGFESTVDFLDSIIERIIPFPVVSSTSSILGRHAYFPQLSGKHDGDLHRPLVRGMKIVSRSPESPLDGQEALLKFFLKRSVTPSHDPKHLERTGRPDTVSIKIGWAPPF